MNLITILLSVFYLSSLGASVISSISYIDDHRIYLSSGEVIKIKNKSLHRKLFSYLNTHHYLSFKISTNNELINFHKLKADGKRDVENKKHSTVEEPSILSTEQVQDLFSSFRTGARRFSQCFNRAHIWAYESQKKFNHNTIKVFLFFTKKFIREHDFKWWFHVAPATYLNENSKLSLMMLDPYFSTGPNLLNEWIHRFVPKKINCREVENFSQYENEQEREDCFTIKSLMYYLQPMDLKRREMSDQTKNDWIDSELMRAYRNGFGIYTHSLY